ncbi:MAG: amidohydrolase [Gemmatimonadaceae bacterium]
MRIPLLVSILAIAVFGDRAYAQTADLILRGATVWTASPDQPRASAIAIANGRILAVGSDADVARHAGPGTRTLELRDRFVAPGFIDNHTHFERAGALLTGANLLDVADESALVRRVREATQRLPEGAWLTGGEWGAYEDWAVSSTGRDTVPYAEARRPFSPQRSMIDSVTSKHPVLLNRWDRSAYLANARALELARATCEWDGVECENGEMTGRISDAAAERVRSVIPAKPLEQRLAESRAALRDLASHGVTTIHDITSAEQLRVFAELHQRNELTVRVYARPTLDRWDELAAVGIGHGFGSEWIRIGGLKGFVDGIMGNSSARFHEPYLTTGVRGSWRDMMLQPPGMLPLIAGADSTGHWPQVHAIGDEAIDTLLTMYESVLSSHPGEPFVAVPGTSARIRRDRRWRVIHTQVLNDASVAHRMAVLGVIAEVQPYHAIDDMRWMEERIGAARSRWAYAFRTLEQAGVLLSFGSDWPGTNASWYPAEPIKGIYAAVTRMTLGGEPDGGWFPGERVSVETALRAYTLNNAWAAGEEDIKGSIAPGKLADLVVLDRDPFAVEAAALDDLRVLLTIVEGKIVYRSEDVAASIR